MCAVVELLLEIGFVQALEDVRYLEEVGFGLPFRFYQELLEEQLRLLVQFAVKQSVPLRLYLAQVLLLVVDVTLRDHLLLLCQSHGVAVQLETHSRHVAVNQSDNVFLGLHMVLHRLNVKCVQDVDHHLLVLLR